MSKKPNQSLKTLLFNAETPDTVLATYRRDFHHGREMQKLSFVGHTFFFFFVKDLKSP